MITRYAAPMVAVLLLAGCAAESKAPPISTSSSGTGPSSQAPQAPQAPNSLPRGSAVQAPLDPPQGNISTTRVGPAR